MCQIEQKASGDDLAIIVSVFSDDLERAIFQQDSTHLFLATDKQAPNSQALILSYIADHLSIELNGKQLQLAETTCETLDIHKARTKVRYRFATAVIPKTISVTNSLLLASIDNQVNMIRLKIAGQKKAASLNVKKTAIEFNL